MTPIRPQFNTGLYAINALQSLAQQNNGLNTNIFGSNFSSLGSIGSEISLFGALTQNQTFSSMPSMMPSFNFSAMPSFNFGNFNFNFSNFNFNNFNFNFGSLLGGGALRASNVQLTSNKARNAVQVALSQVGVREVGNSNNGADVNKYRNGVQNGVAWCASFVSWCYGKGQNSNNAKTFGYTASSQDIRMKAERAGFYRKANSGYTPKVGDVVVWNYGGGKGHVGIVSKVNADGSFKTVEGNCSNSVRELTRHRSEVDGFVMMNEWLEA